MADILRLDNLTRNFGGLIAVDHISLGVEAGERRAIIGPNGAGKTTLFHLISGELPAASGAIYLDGQDVTRRATHERANLGMGRTFQRNNLFFGLTAFENVRLAVQHHRRLNRELLRAADDVSALTAETEALLARVGLAEPRDQI